jgi:hypothetical protein
MTVPLSCVSNWLVCSGNILCDIVLPSFEEGEDVCVNASAPMAVLKKPAESDDSCELNSMLDEFHNHLNLHQLHLITVPRTQPSHTYCIFRLPPAQIPHMDTRYGHVESCFLVAQLLPLLSDRRWFASCRGRELPHPKRPRHLFWKDY